VGSRTASLRRDDLDIFLRLPRTLPWRRNSESPCRGTAGIARRTTERKSGPVEADEAWRR